MVRPLRPPPQPLGSYLQRVCRWLFRLALRGPLWTPLAMGAVAFVVVTALPLVGGAGLGLGQPWRVLALIAAAGGVLLGISAWPARYRLRRQDLHEHELEALRRLPREELAHLVGAVYRRAGYGAVETGRGRGAGIDLELHNKRGVSLVQCRHYREASVDMPALRELHAVMRTVHACRGVVITTGGFTELAGSYARVHGITMVDGRTLTRMLRVAVPAEAGRRLASD
ncbi:MAG TPA: restriction endonuclease [Candidatus Dormibacteraeota bacterium]|nr:restriction endonuclease [Candidatus Dormibacteraeota bacterium]